MGLVAAARYDTRNSVLNPQTGSLLSVTVGAYDKALGGTNQFQVTNFDIRQFWPLGGDVRDRDTDIFGVQGWGYLSTGSVPLAELAQLGSSQVMRGFYRGRFADRHLLAVQGEYRLNVPGPFGLAGFYALGDVEPEVNEFRLGRLRSAYGLGLRYEVDKEERLNLRVDVANTSEGFNFYIQIGEAF